MIKKLINKMVNKEVLKLMINTRAEVLAVIEALYNNNLVTKDEMHELVQKYRQALEVVVERTINHGK